MRIKTFARIFLVCGLCEAAWAQDKLSMVFEDTMPQDKQQKSGQPVIRAVENVGQGCTLVFTAIDDMRINKETVGGGNFSLQMYANNAPLRSTSVLGGDGKVWAESMAQALKRYGFVVQNAPTAAYASGVLPMELRLKLAHVWNAGLSLNSQVTLEASYKGANGPIVHKYQGLATKLNWWNADSEYMETLNLGAADALDAIADDAAKMCKPAL